MSRTAICVRRVSKYFGDFPALRRVELEIRSGRVLAVMGRNGAGKTTLLRVLAGLTRPTRGSVSFPATGGDARRNRARIGVVGHGAWIYDDLTAEENLLFFCRLYRVAGARRVVAEWLSRVGLGDFRHLRAAECSRGMRQRLTIARAFLHDPDVLLLDEPWTALDDRAMQLLSTAIAGARAGGRTVVICSHQLREAVEVADEVALLHRGRLVYHGRVDEGLRREPGALYSRIP